MAADRPTGIWSWKTTVAAVICALAAMVALSVPPATAKPAPAPQGAKQARKNAAGRLDPSFGAGGKTMVPFPAENAGKVGIQYTLPFQFTAGRLIMAPAPGGKLVVASSTKVVRLLPSGKLDRSFGSGGTATIERPAGVSFVLAGVAVDSQGRVLVAGSARPQQASATPDPLVSSAMVRRFSADGSVDTSFGNGGTLISDFGIEPPLVPTGRYKGAAVGLRSIAVDSADRPLLTGGFVTKVCYPNAVAISNGFVARLNEAGGLDPSFGDGGIRKLTEVSSFDQAGLLGSGALFTVGSPRPPCGTEAGTSSVLLASFGPEGNPNPGFGFAGFRSLGFLAAPVAAIAPSGKIILLSEKHGKSQLVTRLLPNGGSDQSFARTGRIEILLPNGVALTAAAVDGQGRVLLAGHASKKLRGKAANGVRRSTFMLMRLTRTGPIDRTFGHKGSVGTGFGGPSSSSATQVMVDARGRILVGGSVATSALGTGGGFAVARYLPGR